MRANYPIRYLRVSLLSNCNLKCFYCRPPQEKSDEHWTQSDPDMCMQALLVLHGMGIRKIRFTGGEPTLYKQLPLLISFSRSLGTDVNIAMTSNGILLDRLASDLSAKGLSNVNISIDTLQRDKFVEITSSNNLDRVISGISEAKKCIPEVKLNSVIIKGVNDDEVVDLVNFANSFKVSIRFIEYMPSRSGTPHNRFISGRQIRKRLPFDLMQVKRQGSSAARYYSSPDLDIRVGFINPVSHPFCGFCDRVRLAANGKLYGCLFDCENVNLFQLLTKGQAEAMREVTRLVNDKKFCGCPGNSSPENLPSFLEMGG